MKKYGFVYIWYDRKHKRFYIGCRWGREDDGYICSSKWMKDSFKRRPEDFKRRILSRVYSNRENLLEEEYRWLSFIKNYELGKRYYNLRNHHFGYWAKKIVYKHTEESKKLIGSYHKGKIVSELTKEKIRQKNIGKKRPKHSEFMKTQIPWNKGKKGLQIAWNKGKPLLNKPPMLGKFHTDETKEKMKISQQKRRQKMIGEFNK